MLGSLLGLGIALAPQSAFAAENLVFVSGAFRRSLVVADLEHLADTGEARGLVRDVLRFSNQEPEQAATLLNQSISLPVTLVSRLLNTRIGEALLERVSQVVHPLRAPGQGVPALRAAVIIGIVNGGGSISAISFLQAYPTQEVEVNIPALLAVVEKASSITDLVRFFSESPLDGLRTSEPQESEQPAQTDPTPESAP